uniref:Uncharacterized protein n=1 Tax=Magnetococcus massalia (strain MO-1) TaxID=451514 RepID=A0A1S7LCU7_MAGMO|nr:Exported protein of unknown function [Candidatus Magnetococcus massalia]
MSNLFSYTTLKKIAYILPFIILALAGLEHTSQASISHFYNYLAQQAKRNLHKETTDRAKKIERYQTALKWTQLAIAYQPHSHRLHYRAGHLYRYLASLQLQRKKKQDARKKSEHHFSLALANNPIWGHAWSSIAWAKSRLAGHFSAAQHSFMMANKLAPNELVTQYNLVRLAYKRWPQLDIAMQSYVQSMVNKLFARELNHPEKLFKLTVRYKRKGEMRRLIAHSKKVRYMNWLVTYARTHGEKDPPWYRHTKPTLDML